MELAGNPFVGIHPGALVSLERIKMDELGVARAMASGRLTSPQQYENMWLFAIRITGTGAAFRPSRKEYVYRDPEIYLNDDFIARCNGLAVIWEHPEDAAKLNSIEYSRRNIGSILLPYIQGNEVWGIAKIYDDEAIKDMRKSTWSTSPSVIFDRTSDNKFFTMGDGKKLLIEGKPVLLDHVAICEQGVWDKGGEPTGVSSIVRGDSDVAEETKEQREAREDRARMDADNGKKLDQLLSGLDSMNSRMDAFEAKEAKTRADAEEAEMDKARKDRATRMDAEHEEFKKADAKTCAADDEEEEGEKKAFMEKGEPEETAADKARAARKDRMAARRKDAAEKEKDGETEEKKKEDESMNDSGKVTLTRAEFDAMQARFASIEKNMPAILSNEDRIAFADEQARADSAYAMFGKQAPAPMQGESFKSYRARLARPMQQYSNTWKGIDLGSLGADALGICAQQVYADSVLAGARAEDVGAGKFREVTRVDPTTGIRSTSFFGPNTIFRGMTAPTRRVVGMGVKAN